MPVTFCWLKTTVWGAGSAFHERIIRGCGVEVVVAVMVTVEVTVLVSVFVEVLVTVEVTVEVGVGVLVAVFVEVFVVVEVGVLVCVFVGVTVGVLVGVSVIVKLLIGVLVTVKVWTGVSVIVKVLVGVLVAVGVAVGVFVTVAVGASTVMSFPLIGPPKTRAGVPVVTPAATIDVAVMLLLNTSPPAALRLNTSNKVCGWLGAISRIPLPFEKVTVPLVNVPLANEVPPPV
jgi:hypothetical protein